MALDFPTNPTNGQVFDDYFWDASIGAWRGIGSPNNLGTQVAQLRNQTVMPFADSTARSAAIPSPTDGMVSYLRNTDSLEIHDGSSWSLANTQKSIGIGFAAAAGSATGVQTNSSYTDWNGPVTVTFTKKQAATRLVITGTCHYSPQGVTTDSNFIAVNIAGSNYQLLQFNSGTQYSLQQRTGTTVITGLAAGTYTATLRYATLNNLYTVAFANSFLTVTEVI